MRSKAFQVICARRNILSSPIVHIHAANKPTTDQRRVERTSARLGFFIFLRFVPEASDSCSGASASADPPDVDGESSDPGDDEDDDSELMDGCDY